MNRKSAASVTPSIIRRAVEDDSGGRHFRVGTEAKSVWVSLHELVHDERRAMAKIGETGIPAITVKSKNIVKEALERQTEFDPALVATRPGWVRYNIYVHANGDVQRPPDDDVDIEVIVTFQPDPGWSPIGTLQEWRKGLDRLIPGNQLVFCT
ncbi:DUF927 domain-containing protein [Paracoccus liaowanqingii]|nr:DUF927 domain-containing protein [Paracoccus liaowanqingii]